MHKYLSILFSGIFAGILIAIGGTVFLALKESNFVVASLLFGFGLFSIITLKLYLYTGKIGYVFDNKANYLLDLLFCLIGNAIGAIGIGYLVRLVGPRMDSLIKVASNISNVKLNTSWYGMLLLSIFCGMMIYLAVEISKQDVAPIYKVIGIFLAVSIFILSGFEHCVANMYYISVANLWNGKAILYLLIMIVGNSIGSIVLYLLFLLIKKLNAK